MVVGRAFDLPVVHAVNLALDDLHSFGHARRRRRGLVPYENHAVDDVLEL